MATGSKKSEPPTPVSEFGKSDGLLVSSRSVSSAKDALRKMGLAQSDRDLENVAAGFMETLELRNGRPVEPDLARTRFRHRGRARQPNPGSWFYAISLNAGYAAF